MYGCDWIIGISCSETDGVVLYRFYGNKEEVKEKLLSLIKEDKDNDVENWDYGCESVDDITDETDIFGLSFYGYGCYEDYHIDYTAKRFSSLGFI